MGKIKIEQPHVGRQVILSHKSDIIMFVLISAYSGTSGCLFQNITRGHRRWGAFANPHAKVFDSPQHNQVPSRGMTLATKWKFCSICFSIFYLWKHTKFGIQIFEIGMLMIFDLFTAPQVHQFDPRMKMLLAFCSARHPRRFDMPHDHVWFFLTPGAPPVPLSPTPGTWPRRQNKSPFWYVMYHSFVRTHTRFDIKIFEIDMVTET